jgi:hypothetical protein
MVRTPAAPARLPCQLNAATASAGAGRAFAENSGPRLAVWAGVGCHLRSIRYFGALLMPRFQM